MSAALVRRWLADGELDLPLPGSGHTAIRWAALAALTESDVTAGRLAEAHVDATAILSELGGPPPQPAQLWGVWAAEVADAVVVATDGPSGVRLTGTKAWCSGAGWCTNALVTARRADGARGLYAVKLDPPSTTPLEGSWRNTGMQSSDTRSVRFTDAAAVPVGEPDGYLRRPGFWWGAIGVAACWLGGARGVAAPLYRAVANERASDGHAHAHLGAVDAALAAAGAMLATAAAVVDAPPPDEPAELLARRVRAVAEHAVEETVTRSGRALGPVPLAFDGPHAQRVADLVMYVRQSHAERDLAALGRLAAR